MGAEERGKQALYIMLMKTYLGTGPIGGGGGGLGKLNMGSALNSVLSSQINSLMGNLKNASVSVGVEDHDASIPAASVRITVSVIRSASSITASRL